MQRIKLIDAVRGLCIVLMVAYHFAFDLVAFLGAPEALIYNPILAFLQPLFAGVFIFISGISCRFSRSGAKRGAVMLACGIAVTLVTYLFGSPAWFGILSFLGIAALLFSAYDKLVKWTPGDSDRALLLILFGALFVLCDRYIAGRTFNIQHLWWLGFSPPGFSSADHFPLLPWIFVYAAGATVGRYVAERRLPERFYTADIAPLSFIGRNTLLIYVLHQPVLYALILLLKLL